MTGMLLHPMLLWLTGHLAQALFPHGWGSEQEGSTRLTGVGFWVYKTITF